VGQKFGLGRSRGQSFSLGLGNGLQCFVSVWISVSSFGLTPNVSARSVGRNLDLDQSRGQNTGLCQWLGLNGLVSWSQCWSREFGLEGLVLFNITGSSSRFPLCLNPEFSRSIPEVDAPLRWTAACQIRAKMRLLATHCRSPPEVTCARAPRDIPACSARRSWTNVFPVRVAMAPRVSTWSLDTGADACLDIQVSATITYKSSSYQ